MDLFLLAGMNLSEMESLLGISVLGVFGKELWLIGLFFLMAFLFLLYRLGVGMEGGIVLMGFAIYTFSRGIYQVGGGQGNLLPDFLLVGFLIAGGFIIYMALKRDL